MKLPSLRLRQKIIAAIVAFIIIFSIVQLLRGGEPQTVVVKPGLVELRLPPIPESADVTWEARQPITQQFRIYEHGTVLVTYLTSGQLVFSSDVIDWDARKRDKTTWIVVVKDATPDPVNPPLTGVAAEVFKRAKVINAPEMCKKVAGNFEAVSSEIGAGVIRQPIEALQRIDQLNRGLVPGSQPWREIGGYFASVVTGKQLPEVKTAFDQIAVGLRKAGM